MPDDSHLDRKFFIDPYIYNCPFCNRRHVSYQLSARYSFDWSNHKKCYVYFVTCQSCNSQSMHLSFKMLLEQYTSSHGYLIEKNKFQDTDIDDNIFYSIPTSFFVMDSRIPAIIRELITEAEGCMKMNFLTGASACTRKAVYELTVKEGTEGEDYESKIKSLKAKFPNIDTVYFDVLSHIQGMTSDKIHEQSWDKWNSTNIKLILETLKAILHEIYVTPEKKKDELKIIQALQQQINTPPTTPPKSEKP